MVICCFLLLILCIYCATSELIKSANWKLFLSLTLPSMSKILEWNCYVKLAFSIGSAKIPYFNSKIIFVYKLNLKRHLETKLLKAYAVFCNFELHSYFQPDSYSLLGYLYWKNLFNCSRKVYCLEERMKFSWRNIFSFLFYMICHKDVSVSHKTSEMNCFFFKNITVTYIFLLNRMA